MSNALIDQNYKPSLIAANTALTSPLTLTGIVLTNSTPLHVSIVDGSGTQITSFGGGTQYTDAASAAAHPIGTGIIFNNAGTYDFVSAAQPLPITGSLSITNPTLGAAVPATANYIAGNNGGNLTGLLIGQQTAANSLAVILPSATITTLTPPAAITGFALETGGNLAAIKADTDKIPSLGQALAASSVPVVLTAAQLTTLTPLTTVAVTGTFWQATQPVSGTVSNNPVAPTAIYDGKTTVTTAGTRVALASTQVIQSVTIKALSTNTGFIYVGNASVASTAGYQLKAGETISFDIANLATIYLDCSVSGEGVSYLAIA